MKKYLFFALILSASSTSAKDTRFDLVLNQGSMLENVVLQEVKRDTLFCVHENVKKGISLNELDKIFKVGQSAFWKGAGIGFVSGAAVGGIIGRASYKKPKSDGFVTLDFGPGFSALGGAALGGGAGFLIGGIVGKSREGSKKEYDLSKLTLERKRVVIEAIMKKQM